jgi:hypothetical protein
VIAILSNRRNRRRASLGTASLAAAVVRLVGVEALGIIGFMIRKTVPTYRFERAYFSNRNGAGVRMQRLRNLTGGAE